MHYKLQIAGVFTLDAQIAAVPSHTTHLTITASFKSRNPAFDGLGPFEAGIVFARLPASITHLYLTNLGYRVVPVVLLTEILAVLPGVRHFSFCSNNLYQCSVEELMELFSALPRQTQTLDLAWNDLGRMPIQRFVALMEGLGKLKVSHNFTLDLGFNALGLVPGYLLNFCVSKLNNVQILGLSGNAFLDIIHFKRLSPSVHTVVYSCNRKTAEEVSVLFPDTVTTIQVGNHRFASGAKKPCLMRLLDKLREYFSCPEDDVEHVQSTPLARHAAPVVITRPAGTTLAPLPPLVPRNPRWVLEQV